VDDGGASPIPGHHVSELASFFAAHDQWLFGHACVRTQGDRDLAADLVQDTFEASAVAWAVLREHPVGRQRAWLLTTLAHKDVSGLPSPPMKPSRGPPGSAGGPPGSVVGSFPGGR
jgi:hypothetical protein